MDTTGYTPEEPIAAIATALAPAALGLVRTSGNGCIALIAPLFSRPDALCSAPGNTLVYGWITDGDRRIDEVMLSVYRAPKSFTGEDMVEISCHGGVSVVSAVYNLLLAHGFRAAEHGEFTFRAYLNGKTDLTKAEAVREIIDAKTDVSRGRAAGRLAGQLYRTIDDVKKRLIDTLAAIEVDIEYPEDETAIRDSFHPADLEQARTVLADLASSWQSEKLYQDGARVVLCGRTNAGKSSLFNALLKEDRAIVSDIAGTTRDWLESWVDFDGIPARLFDTAGLRRTEDAIEARGVALAKDLTSDADLVLYVVDGSAGMTEDDRAFIAQTTAPLLVVWNKSDVSGTPISPDKQCVSAKTGAGIAALCAAVKHCLTAGKASARTQSGLGSERQKVAVQAALESVTHALALTKDYTLDAVVQDLEDALDALGTVTGDVTPDDVLGSIFAHFCVGK
ncbi:MAG: tRNA uridine-5-carboxymethylaminomethyl(34) synthesis GTPase MnmE [Treponemataceae bacterium]|nr:tRNA uridine-5-carboxymethylaminomethyl(34) synthesis GTPase MnmE [Treponemataceae bacterium]